MYTIPQQVAAFTFSVNSAAGLSFNSPSDMQSYVTKISNTNLADTVIQGYIGSDWTPVWGPVVWVNPGQKGPNYVPDNTMACYYSPSQNLFVIAIAGTNPSSMFDWEQEDFDITTMVGWNTISAGSGSNSGYISTGSANGMNVLLTMTSGGTTLISALQTYIQNNAVSGATIAIGGHSLGGALAPCMGLYLYDNLSALQLTGQNIAVYAYAGPTPGNQTFATYYNGRINTTSFTYSSQYNTIDIIPMGSALSSLATIPTIYGTNIPFQDTPNNTFTGVLMTCMQLASLYGSYEGDSTPYTQVSNGLTSFTASFNWDVYNNCSTGVASILALTENIGVSSSYMSELGDFVNFLFQAAAQHGPSYCGGTISFPMPGGTSWTSQPVTGQLGIDDFTVEFQKNLANNKPSNAVFTSEIAVAIKKVTGIDITKLPTAAQIAKRKGESTLAEQN